MKKATISALAEQIMTLTASGGKQKFQFASATVISKADKTVILNNLERLRNVRAEAGAFGLAAIANATPEEASQAIAENMAANQSKVEEYINTFDEAKVARLSEVIKSVQSAESKLATALEI